MLRENKEGLGQYLYWGELLFTKKDLSGEVFHANVRGVDYTMTLSESIVVRTETGKRTPTELTQILSIIVKSVRVPSTIF